MVQPGSLLHVADDTGVGLVKCIKVLGSPRRKRAKMGDRLMVSIKRVNPLRKKVQRARRAKRPIREGMICRAVLVRTKERFSRSPGVFFSFDDNAVALLSRKDKPLGSVIKGPVLWECCLEHDVILAMCHTVI